MTGLFNKNEFARLPGFIKPGIQWYQLGEFEEIVILTVGVLYKQAYGVDIKKDIEERLSRSVSMGALHTALVRLEEIGYIKSYDGEAPE